MDDKKVILSSKWIFFSIYYELKSFLFDKDFSSVSLDDVLNFHADLVCSIDLLGFILSNPDGSFNIP